MDQFKFNEIWDSLEPKPHQRPIDFIWIVDWIEKTKPKSIIEIGVATGGSLKYWEHILLNCNEDIKDCLLIGIDNNPVQMQWDWKNSKIDIHIVHGDSTKISTVKMVEDILRYKKIDSVDFLFIDGEHRYSIPEKDFNNFSPLVKENGIICVADLGEPCASHTFLQLPEPRKVDPTIGMGIWRKSKLEIKVKLCDNHGEGDGAYDKLIDMFRYRIPNPI